MASRRRIKARDNRNQRRTGGQAKLYWLVGLTFAVFLGGASYISWISPAPAGSGATAENCLTGAPQTVAALLIDASDGLSLPSDTKDAPFQTISDKLGSRISSLPPGTQLDIYTLRKTHTMFARRLTTKCIPMDNHLTTSPLQVSRARETAKNAVLAALRDLDENGEAERSPILEALRYISERESFANAPERRLIIVSDMLQHMPDQGYSHYGREAPVDFSALRGTSYFKTVRADLTNAQVEVLYIPRIRYEKYQTSHHWKFWRDYFESAGASALRNEPL